MNNEFFKNEVSVVALLNDLDHITVEKGTKIVEGTIS